MNFKHSQKLALVTLLLILLVGTISIIAIFSNISDSSKQNNKTKIDLLAGLQRLHVSGPIQEGHADIACSDCHLASPGSTRQQLQALAKNALLNRDHVVDFGLKAVSSTECIACHERSNERHPIYRFNEPRFRDALQEVKANDCLGCHSEHKNARVSHIEIGFCMACHEDLKLKNDPLDLTHEDLISNRQWETCLGCHDFHGNHAYLSPTRIDDTLNPHLINDYFLSGPSPYSDKIQQGLKSNEKVQP